MSEILPILFTLILAALVVLAVIAARRSGPAEQAAQRVLLLLETITLLSLVVMAALPYLLVDQSLVNLASLYATPVIFGTIMVILTHLPQIGQVQGRARAAVIGLGLAILALLAYFLREPSALLMALPTVAASLGAAWLISTRPARWVWLLPPITALMWAVYNAYLDGRLESIDLGLMRSAGLVMLAAPVMSVAVITFFVDSGLGMLLNPYPELSLFAMRVMRVEGALRLLAAALVLAMTISTTTWASIWDQTSDGLAGLLIANMVLVTALACAMLIGLRKSSWQRMGGLAFVGLTTLSVFIGFRAGWQVDFPALTGRRAAMIAQALNRFHQREARYPQSLDELAPRDLLAVPGPVMFRGEGWCYQARPDAYRLAAFHHKYFGMPVSLVLYATAGEWGGQPLPCHERLAEMQGRYDWTGGLVDQQPTPTPITSP